MSPATDPGTGKTDDLGWRALPRLARLYVAFVVVSGAVTFIEWFPTAYPQPVLFALLLVAVCLTAAWKVNLPISLASGSTLSVSCAAKLMALLLLGPGHAVVIAVAGALTQCTYKVREPYPLYRTVFSMTAEAITMAATGLVYIGLGGSIGSFDIVMLARPLVGAIGTYFLVNTLVIAAVIAFSTGRSIVNVWREDFLWSGLTFMVAGTAGAAAAVVIDRGYHWIALLLLAPLYLTYKTYELFIGRLQDQQRHLNDMSRMHQETVDALSQAHRAERALASEKKRLAVMLAEKMRLEEVRSELLHSEHAARSAAERANRLKDQFLAIVWHELRTPLSGIMVWAYMLRSGTLDPTRHEHATRMIYDSAQRQAKLIEDLVDVARIMAGKLRLERTFVDLEEAIRGALSVVQPAADAKRIQIAFAMDSSIGAIYGDRSRLQQIACNLLSNAITVTPEEGAVYMRLQRAGESVDLIVTDTGDGIPDRFLGAVFEPFRQADGSTTRHHGGLGLGLSIVKLLVEAHGGAVSVHGGGEGQGATFTVRLPIAPASAEQAAVEMAPRPTRGTRWTNSPDMLEGLTVLVIDDDEESRKVVAAQLEGHRASVLTAASAAEGLDLLLRERVDVLLADIATPDEDGYALIRHIRALHPSTVASVPAAALTAYARNDDRLQALQAGFQLHLAKPLDVHTLVTAVARLGGKTPDRRQAGALMSPEPASIQ